MGIVLRVAFSNSSWAGPCANPLDDPARFEQCIKQKIRVGTRREQGAPLDRITQREDGKCASTCYEQKLCTDDPRWQTALGTWRQAQAGDKTYFVFRQAGPRALYTLWGRSRVTRVEGCYIFFERFEPLPEAKWRENLTARQLVENEWKQGFYRYVDALQEDKLDSLVEGGEPEAAQSGKLSVPSADSLASPVSVELKPHVREKLERIALEEGRDVEEVVREAVGEWLRSRKA
jgi:hypothetical protein